MPTANANIFRVPDWLNAAGVRLFVTMSQKGVRAPVEKPDQVERMTSFAFGVSPWRALR